MNCRKCNSVLPEGNTVCLYCGENNATSQIAEPIKPISFVTNKSIPSISPIKSEGNVNLNFSKPVDNKKRIIFLIIGFLFLMAFTFVIFRFVVPTFRNTTEETYVYSVVGNDKYGYLKLPGEWYIFDNEEENTLLQYINNTDCIVSLEAIDRENSTITAESLTDDSRDEMENGEAIVENITSEKVTVAGYNGYRVYGYYKDDNEWLVEWFFEVGNDKIYYIALEGSDLLEEYFDIPDTFSLTKIE